MQVEQLFNGNSILVKIKQNFDTKIWYFEFNNIFLQTSCFWRLFKGNKIIYISLDNNKKYNFSLPKVDLPTDIINFINKKKLIKIERLISSSDLIFTFDDDIKVIFYRCSTVFENWELHINKKQYVCLNNGEIATW